MHLKKDSISERKRVKTNTERMVRIGDLIVAVFDEAVRYSTDPREVSHLATKAVIQMVGRRRIRSIFKDRSRMGTR